MIDIRVDECEREDDTRLVCVQLLFDQGYVRQRVKEAGPHCLRSNKEGERNDRCEKHTRFVKETLQLLVGEL